MEDMKNTTAADYDKLKDMRQPFIDAAICSAKVTIPPLFLDVDEENEHKQSYRIPDSSVGAAGLNNISATLLLAAFPANTPFFRLDLDGVSVAKLKAELKASGNEDAIKGILTEFDQSLRKAENNALDIMESSTMRADIFEIIRQYLLGQVLIFQDPKTNHLRGFKLNQYVNVRDGSGKVLRYIIQEFIDPVTLPEKVQKEAGLLDEKETLKATTTPKRLTLFTDVKMISKGKWEVFQVLEGKVLDSTKQKYTDETLPYYDIGYNRILGLQYASGFIEGLLGDLMSANGLRRSIVEGAKISARTIFAVDPASTTSPEELMNTPNGGFVRGRQNEITAIRVDKNGDYAVALEAESSVKADLNVAFMSQMAARRDAERVTAEEFSTIAEEINSAMGGTFSRLAVELQQPLARLTLAYMTRKKLLTDVKKAGIKTSIITGISALGRGNDRIKLTNMVADLTAAAQIAPDIGQGLIADDLSLRIMNSNGIEADGLLKSENQKAGEAEAAQKLDSAQQMTDNGVDLAKTAMAHPEGAQQVGDTFAQMMNPQENQEEVPQ